jgi:hypothetical protein
MRKTKAQLQELREAKARQASTKQWLTEQTQQAIRLRSKDREFHGLEREFINYQEDLIRAFENSKDVKHPRDVGDVREALLRNFLTDTGLLPKRYAVSSRRVRVAAGSGHISSEVDIAFYDHDDSFTLMNRSDIYEVLPVESVYGVIQIKSTLNKAELESALTNIASFKRLKRQVELQTSGLFFNDSNKSDTGFGLIFAYDSDMEWLDMIETINNFANVNHSSQWANAVFILKQGFFMHGREGAGPVILNCELADVKEQRAHGRPDIENLCLWNFYTMLLQLLRATTVAIPHPNLYFRLPLVSGSTSYQFQLGYHAEMGTCTQNTNHGSYQRKISPENLEKLIQWCKSSTQLDLIEEQSKIFPRPANLPEPKRKQQHYAYLYNPDGWPLKDLLTMPSTFNGKKVLAIGYDEILTGQMNICIPYVYSYRDGIVSACPKCEKTKKPSPP